MRLLEQGPEVSLLLRSAQVECRPSWAPPISWPYFPPAVGHLPSVDSLIAFTGKKSKSGNGVLKLRRGAEVMKLRTAAIGSAEVGQGCPRSPSGHGGGQAHQPSQDHHRPLRPDSRRAIRGRNECSAGDGRQSPCADPLEVRQPVPLDALNTSTGIIRQKESTLVGEVEVSQFSNGGQAGKPDAITND